MNTVITRTSLITLTALVMGGAALAAPAPIAGSVGHASTTPSNTLSSTTTTQKGPSLTGQPNQSCGSLTAPNTPGNSALAPGSAFNPAGIAGTVYAGQQPQNSRNTASVSQYDAACFHQP